MTGFLAALASGLMLDGAAQTVTEGTDIALRRAMAGGGAVVFACDGTIVLTNGIVVASDTVLDGAGHQVTISGNDSVRVFSVNTNVSFTARHLTITGGNSPGGSAVLNVGGKLTLVNVALKCNRAVLIADGDGSGAPVVGGALYNAGGTVDCENCQFEANLAQAAYLSSGASVFIGASCGGAFYNDGVSTLNLCLFKGNGAVSESAPSLNIAGGSACGGAIYNRGAMTLLQSALTGNYTSGGAGGDGVWPYPQRNWNGRPGFSGGLASGGAICNLGVLSVSDCTLAYNGVSTGGGGNGEGGRWDPVNGFGAGGAGGDGGSGQGGALYNCGTASLVNSTIAANTATGGSGGGGGWPSASGGNGGAGVGGIWGACSLTNCTVVWNCGAGGAGGIGGPGFTGDPPSPAGGPGAAGPAWGAANVESNWINTLVAGNTPGGDDTFTTPELGPLADNGGPTLTVSLLPGSPAINSADPQSAPATDQRGFPRPSGSADIGAYEFGYPPSLSAAQPPEGGVDISVSGRAGQTCWLLASPDLVNWTPIATNSFSAQGTVLFHDAGEPRRFYRAAMP